MDRTAQISPYAVGQTVGAVRGIGWREACDILGCGQQTFYHLVNTNQLHGFRAGNKTMTTLDNIRDFIARGGEIVGRRTGEVRQSGGRSWQNEMKCDTPCTDPRYDKCINRVTGKPICRLLIAPPTAHKCPFFKTVEQVKEQEEQTIIRLMKLGRQDLIDLYHIQGRFGEK